MTIKEFNVWLAVNDYNISTLAARLSMHRQTITNYKSNGFFPVLFITALRGLENVK